MHRLVVGSVALFSVDLIWVFSSELTKHLFTIEAYDKPFFSVFVKTGMFLIFLLGYIGKLKKSSSAVDYRLLTDVTEEEEEDENEVTDPTINTQSDTESECSQSVTATLSPPAFVPINYEPESEDEKSVRFSRVAEVRHLSPKEANSAQLSRMSYQASLQAEEIAFRLANRLSSKETASVALTFCLLWFSANITYQLALSHAQVALVNVLSSSSSLFTLFLAAAFPSNNTDKLTLSKGVCVLISMCGVVVVSLSGSGVSVQVGGLFAVASSAFYAAYLVFLKRKVGSEDKIDVFLFFGFVGLFNLLLLWPLFFLLHYSSLEVFVWPSGRQWLFLLVNGIVGTVFSEVLWVWGCLLTSSLLATLAITMTIPLSMLADVLFKNIHYSYLFYLGSVPMVLAFFGVTLLNHWNNWDPLGECLWESESVDGGEE